jgi:outer membrane protein assembly factor BamB
VTETKEKKYEIVRALERETGDEAWVATWEGAISVPFFARSNGSWIRATPALDRDRLYVAGMRDVLVCLDAAQGSKLWRFDFVQQCETPLPAFGFVCSPLVRGDHVFVQAGGAFAKLNKMTGELVWRTLEDQGGMYGSAFSSPREATLSGIPQILVQTRDKLAGVDPESGAVLWSEEIPAFRGMNILTPTVIDEMVFTSSYGGRSFGFGLSIAEGRWSLEEKWTNKLQGYMSTPVVVDGFIYLHLKNQRFACIDAATGKEQWITQPFGKYWSLIANDDKILALDERGELLLIRANPEEFDLLDRRQISEDPTWAHLAISGNELFVRELNALTAYRWQ